MMIRMLAHRDAHVNTGIFIIIGIDGVRMRKIVAKKFTPVNVVFHTGYLQRPYPIIDLTPGLASMPDNGGYANQPVRPNSPKPSDMLLG